MTTPIEINNFKLSLIWFDTNLSLLGDPDPPAAPMGFLGYRESYATKFGEVMRDQIGQTLSVPWEHPYGQHFWEYYLEKIKLVTMNKGKAWSFLVPFRFKIPVKVSAPWLSGHVTTEAFLYPFGSALIVTLNSREDKELKDVVELSLIARDNDFDVDWPGENPKKMKMIPLADECLNYIRKLALGDDLSSTMGMLNEPFSVFTVIQGSGVDFRLSPHRNGEIHYALKALATGDRALLRSWMKPELPPLDENVMLPLKGSAKPGHVVYAAKRGRTVWFPEPFTDSSGMRHSLSCYHRNMVFLSMQVESLCNLAGVTSKKIAEGLWDDIPSMHRECARIAAHMLGRLYGDVKDTYRSMSPRYHIKQNRFEDGINKVRDVINLEPLKES